MVAIGPRPRQLFGGARHVVVQDALASMPGRRLSGASLSLYLIGHIKGP